MKINDLETALIVFEEFAMKHEVATNEGDYKTANKSYNKIEKAVIFLRNQDKLKSLEVLLNHTSLGVRSWAATYLLPILEEKAILVLTEVAKNQGIRGFAAETTLKEWKNGNLKF